MSVSNTDSIQRNNFQFNVEKLPTENTRSVWEIACLIIKAVGKTIVYIAKVFTQENCWKNIVEVWANVIKGPCREAEKEYTNGSHVVSNMTSNIEGETECTDGSHIVSDVASNIEGKTLGVKSVLISRLNRSNGSHTVSSVASSIEPETLSIKSVLINRLDRRKRQILAEINQLENDYAKYTDLQYCVDQAFGILGLDSRAINRASGNLNSFLREMHQAYSIASGENMIAPNFVNYYKNRTALLHSQLAFIEDPEHFMKEKMRLACAIGDKESQVEMASNSGGYIRENPRQKLQRELRELRKEYTPYATLFNRWSTLEGKLDLLGGFLMTYPNRSETIIPSLHQAYMKLKTEQFPVDGLNKEELAAIEQFYLSLGDFVYSDEMIQEKLLGYLENKSNVATRLQKEALVEETDLNQSEKRVKTSSSTVYEGVAAKEQFTDGTVQEELLDCLEKKSDVAATRPQKEDLIEEIGSNQSAEGVKTGSFTVYEGIAAKKQFRSVFTSALSTDVKLSSFIVDHLIPPGITKFILSNDGKTGEIHFERIKKGGITQVGKKGCQDHLNWKFIFDQKICFSFASNGKIKIDGDPMRISLLNKDFERYLVKVKNYWVRKAAKMALRSYIEQGLKLTVAITGFSKHRDGIRFHIKLINGSREIAREKGLPPSGYIGKVIPNVIKHYDFDAEALKENFSHTQWK